MIVFSFAFSLRFGCGSISLVEGEKTSSMNTFVESRQDPVSWGSLHNVQTSLFHFDALTRQ
jgi:hypothetical protein